MNNIGVHSFLQDHNFTKSCARPPAIGEENEVTSVDGRMSTHSSVSGKSEVSSATPRRTDIDLGFEPEGSASPMCDRWRSSLHNVLEDSDGIRLFKQFLADGKQAALLECWLACKGFRDFGTKNNCSNNSSAASSTTGPLIVQMDTATLQTRGKLARKIFSTYLKKGICPMLSIIIKDATRQYIYKQIKNALQSQKNMSSCFELDASLFDQAQHEIEINIEENSYVSFLDSDLLRKYAAQCETKLSKQPSQAMQSQNQSENKNVSSNVPQVALTDEPALTGRYGYLPRLDEDEVWHPPPVRSKSENASINKDHSLNSTMSSGVSQSSLARAAMERNMASSHEMPGNFIDGPDQNRPAYPYLAAPGATKYYVPPASANASDNASSDATSDTLSITDSSLDVEGNTSINSKKSQKRLIRHHLKRNPYMHYPAEENFISITRRCQYKQNLANLATENPREFFAQLKEKLDKVVEERNAKEREIMEATSLDNEEDILDSHLKRVMKTPNPIDTPNRNQSPPPIMGATSRSNSQPRNSNVTNNTLPPEMMLDERKFRQLQKDTFDRSALPHRASNMDYMAMQEKKTEYLRRRGKEVVVGMSPNEVPDVDVPAQPVDKNFFISEWIKQQDNNKSSQPQSYSSQPRRGSVSKPGRSSKYINPSDTFPTRAAVTSKTSPYHSQPLQPISQDTMMPPLSHPDPHTMLDEVKRRLIEEAERCYIKEPIRGLNFPTQNASSHASSAFSGSSAGIPVSTSTYSARDLDLRHNSHPGPHVHSSASSSGIETATASEGRGDGPHVGRSTSDNKTTCIYFMPHEEIAYKIQIPYSPVTLGQFKSYLRKRGNFRYFFKQYSKEIGGLVKFEIVKDYEVLPLYDNAVVAEIKEEFT